MKLTVLGYWGAYPEKGEATSGYLLETDRHKILLDCGSGVLAQLFHYLTIDELDAVFLSHLHHDHMADIGCLQYAVRLNNRLNPRTKALPIHANPHSELFAKLTTEKGQLFTQGIAIDHAQSLEFDGLELTFQKTTHEQYNLAMRISYQGKTLVYTGDAEYEQSLIDFAQDCDLLLCETSLFADQKGMAPGHMTSAEAAEIAAQARARKLMLTHFPHLGEIEQLKKEAEQVFSGPVELAKCGKVIQI